MSLAEPAAPTGAAPGAVDMTAGPAGPRRAVWGAPRPVSGEGPGGSGHRGVGTCPRPAPGGPAGVNARTGRWSRTEPVRRGRGCGTGWCGIGADPLSELLPETVNRRSARGARPERRRRRGAPGVPELLAGPARAGDQQDVAAGGQNGADPAYPAPDLRGYRSPRALRHVWPGRRGPASARLGRRGRTSVFHGPVVSGVTGSPSCACGGSGRRRRGRWRCRAQGTLRR